MSQPSFKNSAILDDDAVIFLADPSNHGKSSKKKSTTDVEVDENVKPSLNQDSTGNQYYAVRRLSRKQKKSVRSTDPVTFNDIQFPMDYDQFCESQLNHNDVRLDMSIQNRL